MKDKLDTLIANCRTVAQVAVGKIIEDMVFPWYEAKTGKYTSARSIRKAVAKRIERDLSNTLWQVEEDGEVFVAVVENVFSQSISAGTYEIMVTVAQRDFPTNKYTVTLEEFLRDFKPLRPLTFSDQDA